jgi:hypothetical protein
MTDKTGILQHAIFNVPNFGEGYCTDDNARAFILCQLLDELGGNPPAEDLDKLATTYLAFLWDAFDPQLGRFRNFMSYRRDWLEQMGSDDSHARALWAAGTGVARSRNEGHGRLSGLLFLQALPVVESFASPRAWAFTLLGIHEYQSSFAKDAAVNSARKVLTEKLVKLWKSCASEDWPWFEPIASYDNARLCHALILSGRSIPDPEAMEIGLKSLRWLVSLQQTPAGHFRPIGSKGFYERGGARADFDQQPIEANAMVSACLEAFHVTQDATWSREAKRAFEWFLGRNDLGLALYDSSTGGCRDGLHPDRVNDNQGAESSLAFHLSLAEMNRAEHLIAEDLRSAS